MHRKLKVSITLLEKVNLKKTHQSPYRFSKTKYKKHTLKKEILVVAARKNECHSFKMRAPWQDGTWKKNCFTIKFFKRYM